MKIWWVSNSSAEGKMHGQLTMEPLPAATVNSARIKRETSVKADLHGTIFAYDCRMRFL